MEEQRATKAVSDNVRERTAGASPFLRGCSGSLFVLNATVTEGNKWQKAWSDLLSIRTVVSRTEPCQWPRRFKRRSHGNCAPTVPLAPVLFAFCSYYIQLHHRDHYEPPFAFRAAYNEVKPRVRTKTRYLPCCL